MITTKEIAELAGVSRGTVDRVLHNRGGVNKKTSETVLRIANEKGYHPSRAGMALAQKSIYKIGVILNSNDFFEDVIAGMKAVLLDFTDFDIDIIIKQTNTYNIESQLEYMDELANCSGIIMAPINNSRIAKKINAFKDKGCPVVAVNSDIDNSGRLCYVGCDYIKSGMTAGEVIGLITHGHAKVLLVTGSLKMKGHSDRLKGFTTVANNFPDVEIQKTIEVMDDNNIAYVALREAMYDYPQTNAIYFSAAGAGGGIKAIKRSGRLDDITIVTSDSTQEIRTFIENGYVKATICQQPFMQGYNAMKALLSNILFKIMPDSEIYTHNEIKIKYNI